MSRDAREAPLLVLLLLVPAALAVWALVRGSRLALVPFIVLAGQVALWFSYYATDWFTNPGLKGGMTVALLPALGSLVVAAVALVLTFTSPRLESSPPAN